MFEIGSQCLLAKVARQIQHPPAPINDIAERRELVNPVVNILHMFDQILLVTNLMFPEPALPESSFSALLTGAVCRNLDQVLCRLADEPFDEVPP